MNIPFCETGYSHGNEDPHYDLTVTVFLSSLAQEVLTSIWQVMSSNPAGTKVT
jgi:hypothetical protein